MANESRDPRTGQDCVFSDACVSFPSAWSGDATDAGFLTDFTIIY